MYAKNKFSLHLLHPKYYLTWFGVFILFLLVQLPYKWLLFLGKHMGLSSRFFLKRRVSIIKRNLELCFPNKNQNEIDALVRDNLSSLGVALFETGMAWFWSDKRLKRIYEIEGISNFTNANNKNTGILLIGIHSMSLELGGRIMGLCFPVNAMYRPHNNKAMEFIQTKARSRSDKGMIDRRNLKFMVTELKKGKAIWFAPDQDFGLKGTTFSPFFSVKKTSTSKGVAILSKLSGARTLTITLIRNKNKNKKNYSLIIGEEIKDYPTENIQIDTDRMNKLIETEIMRAPDQYLWAHRRFKTRPVGEPAYY
ncbi:LpxL/LpxP family Kdo(2)-lipid IV(A) lauroyl/palmitoleoyl acyltransferase [Proteus myxofaciens]|uniref:Lipid A biosynthesis acyltransferase n=1 Tax=Proteus myxofaciens ATCC 19692 TaxID=1354337 RepID=A0A198FDZ4_9GAMM|nr:LpxL/LpxP family Kdo(2)-lipid IV(A) lauroyl/palmitoleoyl acyltransferase [Proteus myxofaciens]OAT22624.1 lipid A biosynthesis lauroyl acyltransferase [Proteus myxofaciens ATCC 19692]